jgi:hypothetical protein
MELKPLPIGIDGYIVKSNREAGDGRSDIYKQNAHLKRMINII